MNDLNSGPPDELVVATSGPPKTVKASLAVVDINHTTAGHRQLTDMIAASLRELGVLVDTDHPVTITYEVAVGPADAILERNRARRSL